MALDQTLFINPKDFESLEHSILVVNTTTRIPVLKFDDIKITELDSRGMDLQLPKNSCSSGHQLAIQLYLTKFPEWKLKELIKKADQEPPPGVLALTAKVSSTEDVGNGYIIATLEFYQFNEKLWKDFIGAIKDRQNLIENTFNSMKE